MLTVATARTGFLAAIATGMCVLPAQASAATVRDCGRVRLDEPSATLDYYIKTKGMTCKLAKRVVVSYVFGQGAKPINGYRCTSIRAGGRCSKGPFVLVFADRRSALPKL